EAVQVAGGGTFKGFTVRNARATPATAVVCTGAAVTLEEVLLEGTGTGSAALTTGLEVGADCDGRFHPLDGRHCPAPGVLVASSSAATSLLSLSTLGANGIGVEVQRGVMHLIDVHADGNVGAGVVIGTTSGVDAATVDVAGPAASIDDNGSAG